MFSVRSGSPDAAQLADLPAGETEPKILLNGFWGHVTPTDHLVYARGASLWGISFDPVLQTTSGDPVPILADLEPRSFARGVKIADNGTLAYVPDNPGVGYVVARLDRSGTLQQTIQGQSGIGWARVSPDGRQLVVGRDGDLWTYDLETGQALRMTSDPAPDVTPAWSHDGTKLFFVSSRSGGVFNIFEKQVRGGGPERGLFQSAFRKHVMHASMDGRFLLFDVHTEGQQELWVLPLTEGSEPEPFVESEFDEDDGQFSPDGQWVAYASNSSGRNEIYVGPFRRPGETTQVSSAGGKQPKWRADGRELFYLGADGQLMAVAVNRDGDEFEHGVPEALFQTGVEDPEASGSVWGLTPDGQQFFITVPSPGSERKIRVVLNWHQELLERVPVP